MRKKKYDNTNSNENRVIRNIRPRLFTHAPVYLKPPERARARPRAHTRAHAQRELIQISLDEEIKVRYTQRLDNKKIYNFIQN